MTLGNMHRNGERGLFATCGACGHKTELNGDAWPDDVPVRSFGPRMASEQPIDTSIAAGKCFLDMLGVFARISGERVAGIAAGNPTLIEEVIA